MHLRNGRIGVFDLGSQELEEEPFVEGTTVEEKSSIRIADRLIEKHGEDSLVLGTGLLTGSFAPAACAGILRTKMKLMPVLGFAGFELKMSGFDFIVLKGRTETPSYLWVRDGNIDLVASESFGGTDSWTRTDRIRSEQGDSKIQVLSCGPRCDAMSECAQVVSNYWGGEDKVGMGAELGKRKLTAIAVRGMGEIELEDPEGGFELGGRVMRQQLGRLGPNRGFESYCSEAGRDDLRKMLHRNVSCFGCPYPCRSYLSGPGIQGYLLYDAPATAEAFARGLTAADTVSVLTECAKAGEEPVAVMRSIDLRGPSIAEVAFRIGGLELHARPHFVKNFESAPDYEKLLGFGVCPRYWNGSSEPNELREFIN